MSLPITTVGGSIDLWGSLPEPVRCQVLGLLAVLIRRGVLVDSDPPEHAVDAAAVADMDGGS